MPISRAQQPDSPSVGGVRTAPFHLAVLRPSSLVIMGPTASGKTRVAVELARRLEARVVSVDSRQAYEGLDLCSGKDRQEYGSGPQAVEVRGLDRVTLAEEYSLFTFARDALGWAEEADVQGRRLVWCGGTSLYLDALLRGYRLQEAPRREELRREAVSLEMPELVRRLRGLKPSLHNRTDLEDRERVLRALEVALAEQESGLAGAEEGATEMPGARALLLVLELPAPELRQRIALRLRQRLEAGMVREVEALLERGVPQERLHRLGLEPRWVLRHLQGHLGLEEMEAGLAREIWHFARSQGSWLRRFARLGLDLHPLDGLGDPLQEALALVARHQERFTHAR